MNRADIILNEKDPFLREIWAEGWDSATELDAENQLLLCKIEGKIKKYISLNTVYEVAMECTIMSGLNSITWEIHKWIKESDGSADRFRELIRL